VKCQTLENMSSPTSFMLVKTATLPWSIAIICLSQWPAFAAFVPLQQRLRGLQARHLPEKRDFCVIPCGPYGQIGCDLDQVCYTDSSGNGLCSQTSALAAAPSTMTTSTASGGTLSTSSASYTIITVISSSEGTTSVSAVPSQRQCQQHHLPNLPLIVLTRKVITVG
jgi:hypothetical protein